MFEHLEGVCHNSVWWRALLPSRHAAAHGEPPTRRPLELGSRDEGGGVGVYCCVALDFLWDGCELLGMGVTEPSPFHKTSHPSFSARVSDVSFTVKGLVVSISMNKTRLRL